MKIGQFLKDNGQSLSFEFFPPKNESGEAVLFETIEKLSVFKPDYVSVTYGAGGSTKDKTMSIVERIHQDGLLTVMPHLTSIGSGREEIADIVGYYKEVGIENILALRGDPPMGATEIPEVEDGFNYAKELIKLLKTFGVFSIGAAAYPEGHPESPDLKMDMVYTKEKVDAGTDFFVTQMFFDNKLFYGFLDRVKKAGIEVPIIPGIMPMANFEKVERFARMCGASIPPELHNRMDKYKGSPEDLKKAGLDFTIEQCKDLADNGMKSFHFYTLNRWEAVSEIIEAVSSKT